MLQVYRKKWFKFLLGLGMILSIVIAYHTSWKSLPAGTNYKGEVHNISDIEFFKDLTYEDEAGKTVHELETFNEMYELISEAEEFVVLDMFLFNSYTSENRDFVPLADELTNRLIQQKKKHPELEIIFITDQVNTGYGSYVSKEMKALKDNGIEVVLTDLNQLRDSNPLYSSVWRVFFSWMGTGNKGWIPNPFASDAPEVTLRSYLKLMNIKANHRKVVVTENAGIVSTGNPHNESSFHENVAFKVTGPILKDLLEAEKAVVEYSAADVKFPDYNPDAFKAEEGDLNVQYLTEGKIYEAILNELGEVKSDDTIWLGMFYLADRKIVDLLDKAAEKGAKVNIVLDPNTMAFGNKKTGVPNLPVAAEIQELGHENLRIRWYDINKEQYHTKMLYIDKEEEQVIIAGSANFTRRNLANLNLESNLKISGQSGEEVFHEVDSYFKRIWNNENGHFTTEYEEYQDKLTPLRYVTYHLQKWTWFTTY
ncbi:phospholipase D family protein [Halobacillus massiliensis]|uniref:phospholipase D family protein n=1 Tax=Halobacillus massiliensis TaxID=1926286 RepID=UPI0015C45EB3|nr:phospholipase D family protein [Halobacillus massiliensis]